MNIVKYKNIIIPIITFLMGAVLIFMYEQNNINLDSQEISVNKTIAIVNQDQSISIDGESQNFSNYFIDNLMDIYEYDYILTSYSDAKEGVSSTKYSGYIMITSNFTKNINVNVNLKSSFHLEH